MKRVQPDSFNEAAASAGTKAPKVEAHADSFPANHFSKVMTPEHLVQWTVTTSIGTPASYFNVMENKKKDARVVSFQTPPLVITNACMHGLGNLGKNTEVELGKNPYRKHEFYCVALAYCIPEELAESAVLKQEYAMWKVMFPAALRRVQELLFYCKEYCAVKKQAMVKDWLTIRMHIDWKKITVMLVFKDAKPLVTPANVNELLKLLVFREDLEGVPMFANGQEDAQREAEDEWFERLWEGQNVVYIKEKEEKNEKDSGFQDPFPGEQRMMMSRKVWIQYKNQRTNVPQFLKKIGDLPQEEYAVYAELLAAKLTYTGFIPRWCSTGEEVKETGGPLVTSGSMWTFVNDFYCVTTSGNWPIKLCPRRNIGKFRSGSDEVLSVGPIHPSIEAEKPPECEPKLSSQMEDINEEHEDEHGQDDFQYVQTQEFNI